MTAAAAADMDADPPPIGIKGRDNFEERHGDDSGSGSKKNGAESFSSHTLALFACSNVSSLSLYKACLCIGTDDIADAIRRSTSTADVSATSGTIGHPEHVELSAASLLVFAKVLDFVCASAKCDGTHLTLLHSIDARFLYDRAHVLPDYYMSMNTIRHEDMS
mmetsp:Transcript_31050/g.65427  ORF Transcript_31050/g.65427 Transcript_31050/m.65427 type:complete len:163 (+) Transcript_31050:847-1335(+)